MAFEGDQRRPQAAPARSGSSERPPLHPRRGWVKFASVARWSALITREAGSSSSPADDAMGEDDADDVEDELLGSPLSPTGSSRGRGRSLTRRMGRRGRGSSSDSDSEADARSRSSSPKAMWRCNLCKREFKCGRNRLLAHIMHATVRGIGPCTASDRELKVAQDDCRADFNTWEAETKARAVEKTHQLASRTAQQQASASIPIPLYTDGLVKLSSRHQRSTSAEGYDSAALTSEAIVQMEAHAELEQMSAAQLREEARLSLLQAANRAAVPLHVLVTPAFRRAYELIAMCGRAQCWQPPSYKALRTTLLDEDFERVKQNVELKQSISSLPLTVVSDGWTNVNHSHMINVMLVQGDQGGVETFHSAFQTGLDTVSGQYITDKLSEVIEELGPEKVLQVIMDNAANCRLAGTLLQQKYRRLWYTPCQCHSLNLVAVAWGKQPWLKDTVEQSKAIVTFVKTHTRVLEIYRACRTIKLELLKPANTRFASNYIMLERLARVWVSLRAALFSAEMEEWVLSQPANSREAAEVCRALLVDNGLFARIQNAAKICKPLWEAIRRFDTRGPALGHVFMEWKKLADVVQRLEGVPAELRHELARVIKQRSMLVYNDLVGAACLLEPMHQHLIMQRNQRDDDKLWASLKAVSAKFFPDVDEDIAFATQFAQYRTHDGPFGTLHARRMLEKVRAGEMTTLEYWKTLYPEARQLSTVAQAVNSQVASNSSSERNWSSWKHVHNLKRNKLLADRAEKLVFIFCNSRLWTGANRKEPWYSASDPLPQPDLEPGAELDVEPEIDDYADDEDEDDESDLSSGPDAGEEVPGASDSDSDFTVPHNRPPSAAAATIAQNVRESEPETSAGQQSPSPRASQRNHGTKRKRPLPEVEVSTSQRARRPSRDIPVDRLTYH